MQNNIPYSDVNTNVFSIEEDPFTEEIDKLTSNIFLLNAKLKVRDLSTKERSKLKKTRKLMLKELRTTFGAEELASTLSNKLSAGELNRLEDTVITHLTDLNRDRDDNYYVFNDETEEFEIRIDRDHELITQVVSEIYKLDSKIDNPATAPSDRRRMYDIRNKFVNHLRKLGANKLADNL